MYEPTEGDMPERGRERDIEREMNESERIPIQWRRYFD